MKESQVFILCFLVRRSLRVVAETDVKNPNLFNGILVCTELLPDMNFR